MSLSLSMTLRDCGVLSRKLSKKEAFDADRAWLDTFAGGVFAAHGTWVHRGYKWHGYTYGLEAHVPAPRSLELYASQPPSAFYVLTETLREAVVCEAGFVPDLRPLGDDHYVFPTDYSWTMVFTHEDSSGIGGPFFAVAEPNNPFPQRQKLLSSNRE